MIVGFIFVSINCEFLKKEKLNNLIKEYLKEEEEENINIEKFEKGNSINVGESESIFF